MATAKQDVFHVLDKVDANEYKKNIKMGGGRTLSYLSWTDALTGVLRIYPNTTWEVHEFPMLKNSTQVITTEEIVDEELRAVTKPIITGKVVCPDFLVPYLETPHGIFVKVSVTIEGCTRTELLPILDNRNKPIPKPNSFDINTSIKRCLAKCLALQGLGLYIYRGEDLPHEANEALPEPTGKPKVTEVKKKVKNG